MTNFGLWMEIQCLLLKNLHVLEYMYKSNKNSALLTVEENIKKARRTVYNLMDFMEELVLIQRQLLLYLELMYYLY